MQSPDRSERSERRKFLKREMRVAHLIKSKMNRGEAEHSPAETTKEVVAGRASEASEKNFCAFYTTQF